MKRMVLGLLVLSLISLSPVFAGNIAPDESVEGDSPTSGVINIKTKDKLTANDDMVKAVDTEVDKTGLFEEGTEKPVQE